MTQDGYTTSSIDVKSMIENDGLSSFKIVKIKFFKTSIEASVYETRFLKKVNAASNNRFINKSNGAEKFRCIGPLSEEHKQKLRIANVGKRLSEEHKRKISIAMRGRKLSPENIEKIRQASIGRTQSDVVREKHRKANIGKKHTAEAREKMKKRWEERKKNS